MPGDRCCRSQPRVWRPHRLGNQRRWIGATMTLLWCAGADLLFDQWQKRQYKPPMRQAFEALNRVGAAALVMARQHHANQIERPPMTEHVERMHNQSQCASIGIRQ